MKDDFITVPVRYGDHVIGELRVRPDRLPDSPDFCFSLGFTAEASPGAAGTIPTTPYRGPYTLREVIIQPDAAYAEYLRQVGIATP